MSKVELAEANRRAKYALPTIVAKPAERAPTAGSDTGVIESSVEDDPNEEAPAAEHDAATFLGFNPYNYLGRESEGNRFIANNDL